MYDLRLYVVGQSERSKKAVKDLKTVLENNLKGLYRLDIIDVMKNPQMAEDDKILATPTVLKTAPPPIRKIVGDLGQEEKILAILDMIKV